MDKDMLASIPRFHCNSVSISQAYYDVQLLFSTMIADSTEQPIETIAAPQFIAHFSPQHFKAFVGLANKQLENYESTFGEIPVPEKPKKKKKTGTRKKK